MENRCPEQHPFLQRFHNGLCSKGRDLIGDPFFTALRGDFGIAPALEPAIDTDAVPNPEPGYLLSCPSPENAGQVVGAVVKALHCQHHVADFPAKGCTANAGLPAEKTLQQNIVDGISSLN